jgi:hypothetical protein
MKIRELIAHLLQGNDIDDEIIVAYYDKNYFFENLDIREPNKLDEIWEKFVEDGQETINAHLEFTQTGYELVDDLQEIIENRESCGN